jgi:hypothetical protein
VIRAFLFMSFAAVLAACGTPTATCKCSDAEACVFRTGAVNPTCEKTCDVSDAGTACASGTSCGCAASCQGCKNCVAVCL